MRKFPIGPFLVSFVLSLFLVGVLPASTFASTGTSVHPYSSHAHPHPHLCNHYVCDGNPIPSGCKVHQVSLSYANGQILSKRVPGKRLAYLWPYYSSDCGGIYWVAFKNVSGVTLTGINVQIIRRSDGQGAGSAVGSLANNNYVDTPLLIFVSGTTYNGDGDCEDYYNAGIVGGSTANFS